MARYKYFYQGFLRDEGHYSHFGLRIFKKGSYGIQEMATLEWQGDKSNSHWYAGHINMDRVSTPAVLFSVGSALQTLLGDKDFSIYSCPEEVIQKMQEKGWKGSIYDPRFSEQVPLAEVLPSNYHKWGDTVHAVSVVARDEAEARAMIHAKLDEYNYVTAKEQWVEAGERVELLYTGTRVDKTSAQKMLESPFWYKRPEERQ
jgi:hypothetical protein